MGRHLAMRWAREMGWVMLVALLGRALAGARGWDAE